MASRRCLGALSLRRRSVLLPSAFELPRTLTLTLRNVCPPTIRYPHSHLFAPSAGFRYNFRNLSSRPPYSSGEEEEDDDVGEEDEYDGDEEEGDSGEEEEEGAEVSTRVVQSGKSEAEKVKEAAEIGYKVIGPLDSSESPFKPWEPVFAVVQIGSHQFKVSNGDSIFTERLKFCEVNDKLILNKVLMLGSNNQTIIGRPVLPDAAVHAVVEEHALDAKVIIFKKKRRKNYRRTKGHRQELTKLRITDVQGIDKAENTPIAA